jgi:hypothetical protein
MNTLRTITAVLAASIGSASAVETACYSAKIARDQVLSVKLTAYPPSPDIDEAMSYTVMRVNLESKGKLYSNVSFAWEEYATLADYQARKGEDVPEPKTSLLAGKIVAYVVEDDGGHAVVQYSNKNPSILRIQGVEEYPMVLRRNVPGCDVYEERTYSAKKCEMRLDAVWRGLRKVRCP